MDLNLSKQPWYVRLGAFCVLSLAGVIAFYFLYASSAQTDIAAKETALKTLRADIDKGHATERRLVQFNRDVKVLEARYEASKTALPEEKDIGDLIVSMQRLAMQSNLRITRFVPRPPVGKDVYSEMPFEVSFDGSYHNLGLFFDQLGKLPRVINVSNVTLKGKEKATVVSSLTASCVATTYVLNEETAAASAKPAAGAAKPAR